MLANCFVVDVTKPYAEQGSFLEIELAARRGATCCRGPAALALNDDVMDAIVLTVLVNGGNRPVIRDGVDRATRPCSHELPYLGAAESRPPEGSACLATQTCNRVGWRRAGAGSPAWRVSRRRPSPYVGTYLLLRIDSREAGRKLVQRLCPVIESAQASSDPAPGRVVDLCGFTYRGLKALGVPEDSLASFAPEFPAGHGGTRGRAGRYRR